MATKTMTTDDLKAKAKRALEGVPDVWVYECGSVDFGTMTTGDHRIEVEYAALRILGRYPADKVAREEWCHKHRELHGPAIEAAKKALRAAKIRFREKDNGRGIKQLVITG